MTSLTIITRFHNFLCAVWPGSALPDLERNVKDATLDPTPFRTGSPAGHSSSPAQQLPVVSLIRPNLHELAQNVADLPSFVRESTLAMRYLALLGPLPWDQFPERRLQGNWPQPPVPYAPFVAACLVKIEAHLVSIGDLRQYLVDHPALMWIVGFPLVPDPSVPWGFDAEASLPSQRHLTRMLRTMPNALGQFLLDGSVRLLQMELEQEGVKLGECISLDTKYIVAWVKENNHKTYVKGRYDKAKQPAGDPDCRLGCKRRSNQRVVTKRAPATPHTEPLPASMVSAGDYYWGYASGVVATKDPDWGEFVLAELTQPFDQADISYFAPLMAETVRRLGFHPPYGALDSAFDAFYVYETFHQAGGFAAVPLAERGGHKKRLFSPEGLPLCEGGLPMPLKSTFFSKRGLVPHECGRYACPLVYPKPSRRRCPCNNPRREGKGCVVTMATCEGARLRYQLDRESETYKSIYNQRGATERVNALAVGLGIERSKLRNGAAIANITTLIYVVINLNALQRVRQRKADKQNADKLSQPIA